MCRLCDADRDRMQAAAMDRILARLDPGDLDAHLGRRGETVTQLTEEDVPAARFAVLEQTLLGGDDERARRLAAAREE